MTVTTWPEAGPCWNEMRLECFFITSPNLITFSCIYHVWKDQMCWWCPLKLDHVLKKFLPNGATLFMPHFLFYTFKIGKCKINGFYPLEILHTHTWLHRESLWWWWIEAGVSLWILSAYKKAIASTSRKIGFHWFFSWWVTSMYHPLKATDNNPCSPKFYCYIN